MALQLAPLRVQDITHDPPTAIVPRPIPKSLIYAFCTMIRLPVTDFTFTAVPGAM